MGQVATRRLAMSGPAKPPLNLRLIPNESRMSKRPLFLFRRDLRLTDNTGLEAACQSDAAVIPAFIFDPRQCDPGANRFFSKHAFAFLVHSLMELDTADLLPENWARRVS